MNRFVPKPTKIQYSGDILKTCRFAGTWWVSHQLLNLLQIYFHRIIIFRLKSVFNAIKCITRRLLVLNVMFGRKIIIHFSRNKHSSDHNNLVILLKPAVAIYRWEITSRKHARTHSLII